MGRKRNKKREGIGERRKGTCYKNLLFISAAAGLRKFLIGEAAMSNIIAVHLKETFFFRLFYSITPLYVTESA